MSRFSEESVLHFTPFFNGGQLSKEKNLLLLEQSFFSFKSRPYLRNGVMKKITNVVPPCQEGGRRQIYTILECSRLEVYIFNYISQKCLFAPGT